MDAAEDGTFVQAVIARDRSEALIAFAHVAYPTYDRAELTGWGD